MSGTRKLGLLVASLGSLALAGGGPVEQAKLWVSGTSTVQPFKCAAQAVDARVTGLPEGAPLTLASIATGAGGSVRLEVSALDCANGTMNDHMRNALQAKAHPQIRFEVKSYQLGPTQGGRAKLSLEGSLTIAGATRPARLDATATELPGGKLGVTGEYAFNMKDFGVKPPELFFGAMKVDPKVVVGFELKLAAPAAPAPLSAGQR